MKLYLGFYLSNSANTQTPMAEWFSDQAWSAVLPKVTDIAAAARRLGFAGLALDHELYPQKGGKRTATWKWTYPGNSHSEAEVRAKAKDRGAQFMSAMLEGFPDVEVLAYSVLFPETWDEVVQARVNKVQDAWKDNLDIDFWDGMTSKEGYGAIRFVNALFYKTPHEGSDWDKALRYEQSSMFALLSRRFSNWSYASKRFYQSPFAWINAGTSRFEAARPPEYVGSQLDAFQRWGMGGEFAVYAYGGLRNFDYGPYEGVMRQASKPTVVDRELPTVSVKSPPRGQDGPAGGATRTVEGQAGDNLAIKVVRWKNEAGLEGTARLRWGGANDPSTADSSVDWSIEAVPVHDGENVLEITAEDIKGLTATATLRFRS
jgi:hypothetical protein